MILFDLDKNHKVMTFINTVLYACNLLRGQILKEICSCPLKHTHTHTMLTTEVTNVLITLIVLIFTKHMYIKGISIKLLEIIHDANVHYKYLEFFIVFKKLT